MAALLPRGIEIHPQDPRSRKCLRGRFRHLLGARPERSDIDRSAGRAFLRHLGLITAVMADHPASMMQG